jgi:translation initiation factor 5B
MEEKRRLEEEARKAEEERLKAIEEEEKRFEEEEKRKEAEKQRKKEREKVWRDDLLSCGLDFDVLEQAKIELAKKEGRYMTKKQKEDHRLAELRKQALLASGVQVEGLVAGGSGAPANKKVSYGNRKKDNKKGSAGAAVSGSKDASPAPSSPATPAVSTSELPATPQPEPEAAPKEPEEDRDEWDASSDDEAAKATAPVAADVKDDWDASSGEEGAARPAAPLPKGKHFLAVIFSVADMIYSRG